MEEKLILMRCLLRVFDIIVQVSHMEQSRMNALEQLAAEKQAETSLLLQRKKAWNMRSMI